MANSKKTYSKRLKVMPPVAEKPVEKQDLEAAVPAEFQKNPPVSTQPPQIPKKKAGRPVKKSFWQWVQEITPEQWEARHCYIYVYRMEPFSNVRTEGEPGYLRKFYQAIDQEVIREEWGSGKYFLRLKEKRPGERSDRDIEQTVIEIVDPKSPPKMARKQLENDPRNEKWLAMLPKEEPKPQTQGELVQTMSAVLDLQDRLEDRIRGDEPERTSGSDQLTAVLDTATKLVELTTKKDAAPAAPAVDPWAAAERILNMRSDNPMVTILTDQLKTMQGTIEKMREDNARLQSKYMEDKIAALEARLANGSEKKSGLIEQTKELADLLGVEPKEILGRFINGGGDGAAAAPVLKGWMALAADIVPKIVTSPIVNAVAGRIMQGAPAPQVNGAAPAVTATNGNGAKPPQQQSPLDPDFLQFVNNTVTPAMLEYLQTDNDGDAFAEWIFNGYPARLKQLQELTYPMIPGQGAPVIIELYKHADVWPHIAPHEQKFIKFVNDFCKWKPDEEDERPPVNVTATPIDETKGGDF